MLLVLVVGWLEGKCNNFYISTVLRDQWLIGSAVKRSIGSTTGFHNHREGPFASASQSHVFLPWGQCLFSIVS